MSQSPQAPKTIDFYYDFISPYTYLASTQLEKIEKKHAIQFHWIPINLPKLIHYSDNVPPANSRNKAKYLCKDLLRWASKLEVPFTLIPPGRFDSRPALRIASALDEKDHTAFSTQVFHALWSSRANVKADDWLDQVFEVCQFPQDWRGLTSNQFEENTKAALKLGLFGAPTFLTPAPDQEMFFGLDHLAMLEEHLSAHS